LDEIAIRRQKREFKARRGSLREQGLLIEYRPDTGCSFTAPDDPDMRAFPIEVSQQHTQEMSHSATGYAVDDDTRYMTRIVNSTYQK
jgi:hypothetical protein